MVTLVDDIRKCRRLWRAMTPEDGLFDLWDVRACFHDQYRRRPCFLVDGDISSPSGLLALSEIAEHGYWGCFPGETCSGKTWLESNRLIADTPAAARVLLNGCRQPAHLRYLTNAAGKVDEIGYLFRPAEYGYSFDRYIATFSGKSRKKLRRELAPLEACGATFRTGGVDEAFRAFEMNLAAFGDRSYFADSRFLMSFHSLCRLLADRGLLRVTTLLIGDRVAAIDVGAVYRGVYTVLAGGTDPALPGVAKIINFHHLQWACESRLDLVDFLCGDFGWKQRFHLTPRPLYQVRTDDADADTTSERTKVLDGVA